MEFIDFDEAQQRLNITKEELSRLVAQGKLRAFRDGGALRFRDADVDALSGEEPTIEVPAGMHRPAAGASGEPPSSPFETSEGPRQAGPGDEEEQEDIDEDIEFEDEEEDLTFDLVEEGAVEAGELFVGEGIDAAGMPTLPTPPPVPAPGAGLMTPPPPPPSQTQPTMTSGRVDLIPEEEAAGLDAVESAMRLVDTGVTEDVVEFFEVPPISAEPGRKKEAPPAPAAPPRGRRRPRPPRKGRAPAGRPRVARGGKAFKDKYVVHTRTIDAHFQRIGHPIFTVIVLAGLILVASSAVFLVPLHLDVHPEYAEKSSRWIWLNLFEQRPADPSNPTKVEDDAIRMHDLLTEEEEIRIRDHERWIMLSKYIRNTPMHLAEDYSIIDTRWDPDIFPWIDLVENIEEETAASPTPSDAPVNPSSDPTVPHP